MTYQTVFDQYYQKNAWGSKESVSGVGSEINQTRHLIRELPVLFRDFSITSILDTPCGDFNWMKHVEMGAIDYVGADIVKPLVDKNQADFASQHRKFMQLDILKDKIPRADLIICRDCLFHFPNQYIIQALINFCNSQSTFLLTTTHMWRNAPHNKDIEFGQFRRINLEMPPIGLPRPLRYIVEGNTENNGGQADRSMGLWLISDIRHALIVNQNIQKK